MADESPRFATVSTSSLQIQVRVPSRSPSRSPMRQRRPSSPSSSLSRPTTASVARSTSMRHSRRDDPPRPSGQDGNSLAPVYPRSSKTTSRSLSPRPQRPSTTSRPPPPSPSHSGLLPTRSPTPPKDWTKSLRSSDFSYGTHSAPTTPVVQPRRLEIPVVTKSRSSVSPSPTRISRPEVRTASKSPARYGSPGSYATHISRKVSKEAAEASTSKTGNSGLRLSPLTPPGSRKYGTYSMGSGGHYERSDCSITSGSSSAPVKASATSSSAVPRKVGTSTSPTNLYFPPSSSSSGSVSSKPKSGKAYLDLCIFLLCWRCFPEWSLCK